MIDPSKGSNSWWT